jgi:hypothetical protein
VTLNVTFIQIRILKKSGRLALAPSVTALKALKQCTLNSCGHWPLHKLSITPNTIMIFADIQGRITTAEKSKEL